MGEKEYLTQVLENYERAYQGGEVTMPAFLLRRTIELIRDMKGEARPVEERDFRNADWGGWLPAWVQERDGECYWDTIRATALTGNRDEYMFWTAKPTEAQMREVKWDVRG